MHEFMIKRGEWIVIENDRCMIQMGFTVDLLDNPFKMIHFQLVFVVSINFIRSWFMFGFCQNVQIIHQHHHHFYPPPPLPSHQMPPETTSPIPFPSYDINLASNKSNQTQQTYTSKFYHSRRAYLNKSHKGIQVICKRSQKESLFQEGDRKTHNQQLHIKDNLQPNHQELQLSHNSISLPTFLTAQFTTEANPINLQTSPQPTIWTQCDQKLSSEKDKKFWAKQTDNKFSTPSKAYLPSQGSSSRTKKNFINRHQLKESTVGLPNQNIYQTRKKNRQKHHKSVQKTPTFVPKHLTKRPPIHHHSRHISDDRDSMMTQKYPLFLKVFPTETLLEDAKSIQSLQSSDQLVNIQESFILSRSMEDICRLTPEIVLPTCRMYLAKDNHINLVVTIRVFDMQQEQTSFSESILYNQIATFNQQKSKGFAVLELYKVLVEGVPPHKRIIFILEPYEQLLQTFIATKRVKFRQFPSLFEHFKDDLHGQLREGLMELTELGLGLRESLTMEDIVMVNGRFKFHSLSKFDWQIMLSSPKKIQFNLAGLNHAMDIAVK